MFGTEGCVVVVVSVVGVTVLVPNSDVPVVVPSGEVCSSSDTAVVFVVSLEGAIDSFPIIVNGIRSTTSFRVGYLRLFSKKFSMLIQSSIYMKVFSIRETLASVVMLFVFKKIVHF